MLTYKVLIFTLASICVFKIDGRARPSIRCRTRDGFRRPTCTENVDSNCDPANYPEDTIVNLIDRSNGTISKFFKEKVGHRPRLFDTSEKICDETSDYIFPRAAKDKNGKFKFIVNNPNGDSEYRQIVHVTKCGNAGMDCANGRLVDVLGSTNCRQEFTEHKLVALNECGDELVVESFSFPSCCSCVINE